MEVHAAGLPKLRKQFQSPISSHHDENQGDDAAADENINDLVMQQSKGVEEASESPNSKAFRELIDDPPKCSTHGTPTKTSVKLLERPQSSGDDMPAPMQYKMTAPAFRPVQIKRPCVLPTPSEAAEPQSSTEEHLARPATRGKDTATVREQDQAPEQVHFNFAPNQLSPRQAESPARQPQTVLPSIEVDNVLPDDVLVGGPSQHDMQDEALTPKANQDAQMPPPAPRARRQTAILHSGIVKHSRPNLTARYPPPQRQPRIAVDAIQPSEEDLLFLLMGRNREAKHREEALDATLKRMRGQLHRLHEQTGTAHQQLTAANARCTRQNTQINAYQAQIEDFKTRFTKLKKYAKDLTQDYTEMGKAMKNIGNTTNEMIKDKAEIDHNLESLRKSAAIASGVLVDLRPKITAASKEIGVIQHTLQLAKVEVQMTHASLQHERARNNRIESQMLGAQHTQERLKTSSMQEYRNAAGYLDEICKAIIHLSAIVTKKEQPKDTPGVLECLGLLQTLTEKQGTSTTTLDETKALVIMVSDR
jgi:predicted  nucleic acid-binding Zn-ribbon protein